MAEGLNGLATGVWFIAQDGSLSSTGSLWEVATDVTELRDKLRHALPDTALSAPTSEHPPLGLPLGLLALGAVAAHLAGQLQTGATHPGHPTEGGGARPDAVKNVAASSTLRLRNEVDARGR